MGELFFIGEHSLTQTAINAINDLAQCPDLTSEQLILLT
jgi:hypothetical protein